jgi:ribosomal protein S27AE
LSEFEEKILEMLKKIDEKLDKVLEAGSKEVISAPQATPKVEIISSPTVKPSAIVDKQEAEEKAKEKPPVEGRRVCPDCGGTSFNAVEDKSQVLFQQGGMKVYAKKYICRKCGKEV